MMKYSTVYHMTGHCEDAGEIVESLFELGLGRAVIADECRKLAAVDGPRSALYQQAAHSVSRTRNAQRECNALGGA